MSKPFGPKCLVRALPKLVLLLTARLRNPSRHLSRHLQDSDSPAIPWDAGACTATCNVAPTAVSDCMSMCRCARLLPSARNFRSSFRKTGTQLGRFLSALLVVDAGSKCSCAGPCASRCSTASSTTSYPARTKSTRRSSATNSCECACASSLVPTNAVKKFLNQIYCATDAAPDALYSAPQASLRDP